MDRDNPKYDEWLLAQAKGGSHYYGDQIRRHMMLSGILLIILIPLDRDLLQFYLSFGVVFILFSVILAGLTNPDSQSSIIADFLMSLAIAGIFEFLAIAEYFKNNTIFDIVFILRQAIAIVSLTSLYLATKTLRGMYYKAKNN